MNFTVFIHSRILSSSWLIKLWIIRALNKYDVSFYRIISKEKVKLRRNWKLMTHLVGLMQSGTASKSGIRDASGLHLWLCGLGVSTNRFENNFRDHSNLPTSGTIPLWGLSNTCRSLWWESELVHNRALRTVMSVSRLHRCLIYIIMACNNFRVGVNLLYVYLQILLILKLIMSCYCYVYPELFIHQLIYQYKSRWYVYIAWDTSSSPKSTHNYRH